MDIECVDEQDHKNTFKSPVKAVEWLNERERKGKPPVRFTVNGRYISIKRLKEIASLKSGNDGGNETENQ
jgi:hypothetical protein